MDVTRLEWGEGVDRKEENCPGDRITKEARRKEVLDEKEMENKDQESEKEGESRMMVGKTSTSDCSRS